MGFWDANSHLLEQGGFAGASGGQVAGPLFANQSAPGGNAGPAKGGSWTTDANGNWSQVDQSEIANQAHELGAGPMSPEGQPQPQSQNVGHNGTFNGMNREQYRDAWMSSGAKSVPEMQAWLQKNGGTMTAANGTVTTPFGESLDMGGNAKGSAAGRGNLSTQWGGAGGPAGGPGGNAFAGGNAGPGGFGGFSGGGGGGFGGGGGMSGGWDGQKFTAQTIDAPTDYNPQAIGDQAPITADQVHGPQALTAQQIAQADPFHAPTADDLALDPGYQVRQRAQQQALEGGAAARGLLRSGGTYYDLMKKNGELASDEYGKVYGRRMGEYQTHLADRLNVGTANNSANAQAYGLTNQFQQGAAIANQGANLAARTTTAGMRFDAARFNATRTDTANQQNFSNRFSVQQANNANAQGAWQGNVNAQLGQGGLNNQASIAAGQLGLGYHSADQQYSLGMANNALGYYGAQNSAGLGWANYGLNADAQNFDQSYRFPMTMGYGAASQMGGFAGGYSTTAGNNATGSGNAAASGRVGSANAWNNGIAGAFNAGMGAYGAYQGGQNGGSAAAPRTPGSYVPVNPYGYGNQ